MIDFPSSYLFNAGLSQANDLLRKIDIIEYSLELYITNFINNMKSKMVKGQPQPDFFKKIYYNYTWVSKNKNCSIKYILYWLY